MSTSFNPGHELDGGWLENVSRDVSRLAEGPDTTIPAASIRFWHDPRFHHTRIDHYQPPSYYEDYLLTATYSDAMQRHQAEQAARLMGRSPRASASFVEVGCGDGSFMRHMRQHGAKVLGIEPSRRFALEARRAGFEVLEAYVSAGSSPTSERFDLFASRQVFEHVPDPIDVLTGIRQLLTPGAVGVIEVPNGYRSVRESRFYDFFTDHVQHYSVNSLVQLATVTGFNVIECRETFGNDYLELWLRLPGEPLAMFEELRRVRREVCGLLVDAVRRCQRDGFGPVALWGCGAKTLSILANAGADLSDQIDCVIDSDPHKQGLYIPNTRLRVVHVDAAAPRLPRAVLVLALSYREEIASLVRARLPTCRKIFTLDNSGDIVEL